MANANSKSNQFNCHAFSTNATMKLLLITELISIDKETKERRLSIADKTRNTRYKVKNDVKLILVIDSSQGVRYEFIATNISITGLGCRIIAHEAMQNEDKDVLPDLVEDGIISSSRLVCNDFEVNLGRLVLRRKMRSKDYVDLAFSVIDIRIPIDGKLSQFLEVNFQTESTYFDVELNPEKFNLSSFLDQEYSNIDLFDRTRKFATFYKLYKKSDKFAYFMPRESSKGPRVNIRRKRSNGRNDYIMMGSNDYLGLSCHPKVIEAAKTAIDEYGVGATGTPPTSGTSDLHEKLCKKLASMYDKEAALVYPSGFGANSGSIACLCREQDLIVADFLSHTSIQEGIMSSRAAYRFFKHNDMDHLEKTLSENRSKYFGCLIVTEGLFSMDGTIGQMDAIVKLAKKYDARVFIDQGHCIGVLGDKGLGTIEKFNVIDSTDMVMGLFSKGLGTMGGFIAADESVIQWLKVYSKTHVFATTFPPSNAAATLAAIEIMETQPELRTKLISNVKLFVKGLVEMGALIDPNHYTPIVPIVIGDETKMGLIFQHLLNDGIFALPVVYPVVARNRCRFRFSVRADHTISDIDYVLNSLKNAFKIANFRFEDVRAKTVGSKAA